MFRPFHWRCDTPNFTILVAPVACEDCVLPHPLAYVFPDVAAAQQQLDIKRYMFAELQARCFLRHPQTGALCQLRTQSTYCLHISQQVIAQLDHLYEDPALQRFILEPLREEMDQMYPHLCDEFSAQTTCAEGDRIGA